MGKLFEPREAEKTSRSFDGMNGTKDLGNQSAGILWPGFELCKAPLHPVEAFLALSDKFQYQIVHIAFIGETSQSMNQPILAIALRSD